MAFDFEKLIVYQKAKVFNHSISTLLEIIPVTRNKKDQLERASFSILLNIAEGTGRHTNPDKRHFYVIARGSVFECVAILDYLHEQNILSGQIFHKYYAELEEISKMIFAMIQKLGRRK